MLKYYKNNSKKNIPLNIFLKQLDFEVDKFNSYEWYTHYFYYYLKKDLCLKVISQNEFNDLKYEIIKDLRTDTWFFVCSKLVVFYISENDFPEFYFSFVHSDIYSFKIFKNDIYYVAFCISHTSDMINDLNHFLISNNTSLSYFVLSKFLYINDNDFMSIKESNNILTKHSSFVIVNTNYKSQDAKIKYELIYQIKLGNGNVNNNIISIIQIIQAHIKNNTYLPVNYLSIA